MDFDAPRRSGSSWAKGCGLACAGCAVVLVGVVALVLTLAPGAMRQVRSVFEQQQWLADWQGPEPEGAVETLLPPEVDGLSRGEVTAGPGPEALGLQEESLLATVYGGERTIEVWAGQVAAAERGRVFSRVEEEVARGDWGSIRQTRIGNVLTLTFGRPPRRVSLWWADDWLFVFRAETAADLGSFPEALLRAIEQPSAAPIEPGADDEAES